MSGCGTRRQTAVAHRFQHLRSRSHRLAREIRFGDELLLKVRDFLNWNFHAKVTACDHDAVSRSQDFVIMREGIRSLNFGDDKRMATDLGRGRTDRLDVGPALDNTLAT